MSDNNELLNLNHGIQIHCPTLSNSLIDGVGLEHNLECLDTNDIGYFLLRFINMKIYSGFCFSRSINARLRRLFVFITGE